MRKGKGKSEMREGMHGLDPLKQSTYEEKDE